MTSPHPLALAPMNRSVLRRAAVAIVTVLAVSACDSPARTPAASPPLAAPSPAPPSSAAPSPSPSPSPTPTDCVTTTLAGLAPPERVGQLLMVGTSVDAPTALGNNVARYHLGGVFLHGRSTRRAADLKADIAKLQERAELPLLISLDQEGGSVQTLKGRDFPILPSARRLGDGPVAELRDTTHDSARRLDGIGVTINLAPVADTVPDAIGRDNPPIGAFRREYGSDPDRVAAAIRTFVPASQDAGVLTVLKHFPGLGRVRENTDTSTDAVDATATASDPYLKPFAAGIEAGTASVMMSSASYPRLDRSAIAAFSKPIITDLLRGKLGFQGLVMSDDLGAGVAVSDVPTGSRAVRFVAAGGDLVLTIRPKDAGPMADALLKKAGSDQAFQARVDDAARHVLRAKEQAGLLRC